jgi:phage host-nuclease inhibitor protein Gam
MFSFLKRKSKINELEKRLETFIETQQYDGMSHVKARESITALYEEIKSLRKTTNKLHELYQNMVTAQWNGTAADLVSNLDSAKPSAPAVQIKKVKKVKTK